MSIVGYIGFAVLFLLVGIVFWEIASLRRETFGRISQLEQTLRKHDRQWQKLKPDELHTIIEQQDELIAVLWHDTVGLRCNDAYPEDDEEKTRFGISAPFSITSRWYEKDQETRQPSLRRNLPYPWQKHVEELTN